MPINRSISYWTDPDCTPSIQFAHQSIPAYTLRIRQVWHYVRLRRSATSLAVP